MVAIDKGETLEEFLRENLKKPNNRKVIFSYIDRFLKDEDLERAFSPNVKALMTNDRFVGLTYFPINDLGPMRKGAVALSNIYDIILTIKSAGLLVGSKIRCLEADGRPWIVQVGDSDLGFMIAPLIEEETACSECGKIVEDSFSSMCHACETGIV